MVAGPNGSGKTTLIETLRASPDILLPSLYINADDLGRRDSLDARTAQKLAASARQRAIAQGESFLYETVMSHPGKIAELQAAATAGYVITIVFVATDDPDINVQRVALRVADGGHDVPRERIRARYRRTLALAPSALAFAAQAYVYDNTAWGTEAAHQLQAVQIGTMLQPTVPRPATWVAELIERTNARAAELTGLYHSVPDRAALNVPDLASGVTEGVIAAAGPYYVLQTVPGSAAALIHDQGLLPKPAMPGQSYRIEYVEGVAKMTRRPGVRMRAIKSTRRHP